MDTIRKVPPKVPYVTSTGYGFAGDATMYRWECPWCGSHGQASHDKKIIDLRRDKHERTCSENPATKPVGACADHAVAADLGKLFEKDPDREPLICAHWEANPLWVTLPGNRFQLRYCHPCLIELYARTSKALDRHVRARVESGETKLALQRALGVGPVQDDVSQSLVPQQGTTGDPEDRGATMLRVLERAPNDDTGLHECFTLDCLWNGHKPESEWGKD